MTENSSMQLGPRSVLLLQRKNRAFFFSSATVPIINHFRMKASFALSAYDNDIKVILSLEYI